MKMLRSQTIQPVRSSVKKMSRRASSTGRRRDSQCSPPSVVESSAPLPPTAHPRDSSTKKTECSQANVPVCCFRHGDSAEALMEKARVNSAVNVSEHMISTRRHGGTEARLVDLYLKAASLRLCVSVLK